MINTYFIVIAFKQQQYVYPIGVFSTRGLAIEAMKEYREQGNHEYNYKIYRFKVDTLDPLEGMIVN